MIPTKINVRFVDCDMMGHVNNAVYLSYFEQTRMHYFYQLLGKDWDWKEQGIILVKNEVEYLKPILLHDNPEIYMYLDEIGNKSFTLSYEVKVNDYIYAKGKSTLVCFDYKKQHSVAVYPTLKIELLKLKKELKKE